MSISYLMNCFSIVFVFIHAYVYFSPNVYQLPFNCYIFFLPIDGFWFAWQLNYFIITAAMSFSGLSIAFYILLPFIFMNQSCWLLDMVLITAKNCNEVLKSNEGFDRKIEICLKKIFRRCEKFVEWQSETQNLLFWYFNLEFQVQSLILCLSIYVLTKFVGGVILLLLLFCTFQMFVLCLMGTRVTSRIDQLSHEISKNWHLMSPQQRKSLQMILHWIQNMKGFSGIFKDVNLVTCKAVNI